MDFASSGYARDFFQGQVPQIIRSLKSIADSQQKLVELQMQNTSSTTACESRTASSVATVFVCYEENCAELFDEAGAVNHMFVTADAEQAISWAKHSLSRAEENNYLPVDEAELQQFFDDAGKEQFASVWVYRDKNEFAKESYGICVDRFDLAKSDDLLSSMFA